MKKLIIIFAVNLLLLSCSNTDFKNPEAVVRDFNQLLIDNKLDKAYELITDYSAKNYSFDDFKKFYGNLDSLNKLSKTEILKIEQIKYDSDKADFRLFSISKRKITLEKNDTILYKSYFTVFKHNEKWKIIWINPLIEKANNLESLGKYKEAKVQLEKAYQIDPYNGNVLCDIAWYEALMNNNETALNKVKSAIELIPNESRSYNIIATIYSNLGEMDLAIENTNKAIMLCQNKNDKAPCLGNLAIDYCNVAKYNMALDAINKAIKIDSLNSFILRVKGEIYKKQNKNDSSTIYLSKAVNLLKSDEENRMKEVLYFSYSSASFDWFTDNKVKNASYIDSAYKYIVKAIDINREDQSYRELLTKVKKEMK